ncbi:MAG: dipeptidase [Anaerolineae bacterium]|jgi:acetylornithine deacetylase/succinyl-diaminopimelate desuccinylase-like protein
MSKTWQTYLAENRQRLLDELVEFLRIPSMSAPPEAAEDVARAGAWIAAKLERIGLENVAVMRTGGHPVVYGDWLHAPGKPTYLVYGHFDTQPVDPLELWKSPPFEPQVTADRIVARGACDNKGGLFLPVIAAEALLATSGKLPVNIKFFFEGQEEIGSPQLPAFVRDHRDLLACDAVLNADSGQYSEHEPGVLMGLRGICSLQIDMVGPDHDLHSGSFGGAVQNPLHAMVMLLDSMRGHDGRILVEGFYDDVIELSQAEREAMARVPFDEARYKAELGVDELFGEPGYAPWERTSIRPTLELNGLWGGFTGKGNKTVLPSEAHCKITCRLVPDQNPDRILQLLQAHIATHTPPGVNVIVRLGHGTQAYSVPADLPALQSVREVLTEVYGMAPYDIRAGGSVPITALFREELGAENIGFGFGLDDELVHSPNEFFRLASFDKGQRAWGLLLERLGA